MGDGVLDLHRRGVVDLDIDRSSDEKVVRRGYIALSGHLERTVRKRKYVLEHFLMLVIDSDGNLRIDEDSSGFVFKDLHGVAAHRFHRDALEAVLVGIEGHAVYSRHPEPVSGVTEEALDLVVRKGIQVVCTEILVEFVDIETVQSTEGSHPYVAMFIFCKR